MNDQDEREAPGTASQTDTNVDVVEDVADLRREYEGQGLEVARAPESPYTLFEQWFDAARRVCEEPSAMVLSTVAAEGGPSSRVVLMKGVDQHGFVFYTNYRSLKVREIDAQPLAALNFFWPGLHRQIRMQGKVARISEEASDDYFRSRPRGSQVGAWASPQSEEIESRRVLERSFAEREAEFDGVEELPRPPHWGGLRLAPKVFEFWQGQRSRLHDRLVYENLGGEKWSRRRLAP